MSGNLVSVSQLTSNDVYDVQFVKNICLIPDKQSQKSIAQADMIDYLFSLRLDTKHAAMVTQKSSIGSVPDSTLQTLHSRLGHVGESKLVSLHKPQLYRHKVPALQNLPFCEPCASGKIKKQPFAK